MIILKKLYKNFLNSNSKKELKKDLISLISRKAKEKTKARSFKNSKRNNLKNKKEFKKKELKKTKILFSNLMLKNSKNELNKKLMLKKKRNQSSGDIRSEPINFNFKS